MLASNPFYSVVDSMTHEQHFEDLPIGLLTDARSVELSNFIGRGAFASVFVGCLHPHTPTANPNSTEKDTKDMAGDDTPVS